MVAGEQRVVAETPLAFGLEISWNTKFKSGDNTLVSTPLILFIFLINANLFDLSLEFRRNLCF